MSHATEFVGEDQARKLATEHLQSLLNQCHCGSAQHVMEVIQQLVVISMVLHRELGYELHVVIDDISGKTRH